MNTLGCETCGKSWNLISDLRFYLISALALQGPEAVYVGQGGQVSVGQRVSRPCRDTEDSRGGVRRLEVAAGTLVSIEIADLLASVLSEFF